MTPPGPAARPPASTSAGAAGRATAAAGRGRPGHSPLAWWSRRSRRTRVLVGTSALGVLLAVIAVFGIAYAALRIPLPAAIAQPQAIRVTYADGSPLATLGSQNREDVAIGEVPQGVVHAVLAAEDRNFFHEPAISVRGIARALFADIRGGGVRQGGSTITQQYAKNAYLTQSRTVSRKLKELVLAIKLGNKYSKNQILEFYLNTIYFGRGTYGIQAASKAYFGEPVSALTPEQGAVLSGLIRAPSGLDPRRHPVAARTRYREVIATMGRQHWLTPAATAHDLAAAPPTTLASSGGGTVSVTGPDYFVTQRVKADLVARLGEARVSLGGLVVTTTLNPLMQKAAVTAVTDQTHGAPTALKAALVAVQPGDGAIRAYYGGNTAGQGDALTYYEVPPGSTFKPVTLAAALAHGTPLSQTYNGASPQTISGYTVSNFNAEQFGAIDLPTATANSVNTVYVQLARDTGPQRIIDMAHQLGYVDNPADPLGQDLSITLGEHSVHPLDMATVFSTFAAQGTRAQPYLVTRIADLHGRTLFTAAPKLTTGVLDAKVAADTTYALQQVIAKGTAAGKGLPGRPAAGKTGTVTNNTAAWFCGFTPQLESTVALFEPKPGGGTLPLQNLLGYGQITGGTVPAAIWQEFMTAALAGQPVLPFPNPATLTAPPTGSPSASPSTTPTSASPTPSKTSRAPSAPPTSSAPPTVIGTTLSFPAPVTSSAPPGSAPASSPAASPSPTPTGSGSPTAAPQAAPASPSGAPPSG